MAALFPVFETTVSGWECTHQGVFRRLGFFGHLEVRHAAFCYQERHLGCGE